jgi:lycopene beta-cyclase
MDDVLLVGGGFQAGLCALAVLHARPDARLTIIEAGSRLGGNHTWSFHGSDVPPEATDWMAPLLQFTWSGYDVFFPDHTRTLRGDYASLTGEHLHSVVAERVSVAPQGRLLLNRRVKGVDARGATLEDGRRLEAHLVIDCRGPTAAPLTLGWQGGWQKFVGIEVELSSPHGLTRPILMDARVEQRDGFRFLYVLPLSPSRLLVEDTAFSDDKHIDVSALRAGAEAYCQQHGWLIEETLRVEQGCLPMPVTPVAVSRGPALAGGYAGGWFHPGTGYSTPIALRLACFVGSREPMEVVGDALTALSREIEHQQRYALLLNELLFLKCPPDLRWDIFSRFYRQQEDLISRYYALQSDRTDRIRALFGRPPKGVSVVGALGPVLRYVRERHTGRR